MVEFMKKVSSDIKEGKVSLKKMTKKERKIFEDSKEYKVLIDLR